MGDTDYVYGAISNVSTNSFDITNAVSSGDSSGTDGAYIPAAEVDASDEENVTVSSPSAGDITISTIKIVQSSNQFGSSIVLTVPTGITNGIAGNTSFETQSPVIVFVYASGGGYASAPTPSLKGTTGADFNEIEISAGLIGGTRNFIVYHF